MALDANIRGSTSGLGAEVNASNQLKVVPETNAATNPGNVGAIRIFSENDAGTITGTPNLISPETTTDYRLRTVNDTILDDEVFCYANQNTGKHSYAATTLTMALASNALVTNSGNITTINTASFFRTQQ